MSYVSVETVHKAVASASWHPSMYNFVVQNDVSFLSTDKKIIDQQIH